MGERGVPEPALVALAALGYFNNASGENFPGLLRMAVGVRSSACRS
jgi:hypothetical protein